MQNDNQTAKRLLVFRVAPWLMVAYLLVLAGVAFLPLPGSPPLGTRGVVPVHLSVSRPDIIGSWEAERNVLMTVPLGLLLPFTVRWPPQLMALSCLGVSLVIETGQLLGSMLAGYAWRFFDVDDLLNNTVGGLIGLALSGTALFLTRARTGGGTPTRRQLMSLTPPSPWWAGCWCRPRPPHPHHLHPTPAPRHPRER